MKGVKHKQCTCCYMIKSLVEFNYKTAKKNARRAKCKSCESALKQTESYKRKQTEYARNRRKDEKFRSEENQQTRLRGSTIKGRANRLFLAARHRAKVGNLEFTITQIELEVLLHVGKCQKTGLKFDYSSPKNKNFNPLSPSVDRKNPYAGYTTDNIQIVCNAYNLAKNQMTDNEFLDFCKIVVRENT